MNKGSRFGHIAIRKEAYGPVCGGAGNRQQQVGFRRIEGQPVGAGYVVQQAIKLTARAQAEQAAVRRLQAALALIGEIKIAGRGKVQIVHASEALEHGAREVGFDASVVWVEHHDSMTVVGDENSSVQVNLQAVGFAVGVNHRVKLALRIDADYTAIVEVEPVNITVLIEGRHFNERL